LLKDNFLNDLFDADAEQYIVDYLRFRPLERLNVLRELLKIEYDELLPMAYAAYVPNLGKGGEAGRERVIVEIIPGKAASE
jgi:hypothetical protein